MLRIIGPGTAKPTRRSHRHGFVGTLLRPVPIFDGLTWRRVGYTFAVATCLALFTSLGDYVMCLDASLESCAVASHPGEVFASLLSQHLCLLFPQMLAATVADNLRCRGRARVLAIGLALLLGTLVGYVILLTEFEHFPDFDAFVGGLPNGALVPLVNAILIAAIYFRVRADRALTERIHDANVARIELQKSLTQSRLKAIQAQVEPAFLVGTLRNVVVRYRTDASAAGRMLDCLIAYLRAALPQVRTNNSTLGAEAKLVRTYLELRQACAEQRLAFSLDLPEALADLPFPPMVLLPLVEHAADSTGSIVTIAVNARANQSGGLAVNIRGDGPHPEKRPGFALVTERLVTLYGSGASLTHRPTGSGWSVTLEVPR
jgi:hypothetical protein